MVFTKNLKILFFTFILIFPLLLWFWPDLEDFLYQRELNSNPYVLASLNAHLELEAMLEEAKPIRKVGSENLEISAVSAISVFIDEKGGEKVLFEKNIYEKLPIASLTKLMTAHVALEYYLFSDEINDLIHFALIESSNNAALSLSQKMDGGKFVELMNREALKMGLENTNFINSTGLDGNDSFNYSTCQDLVKLAKNLNEENPLIWEISIIPEFENATNTNRLLGEIPGIIGGKTAQTPGSGPCLLLISEAPEKEGYVISVILDSEDRFGEMKKLINWLKYAYEW